MEQNPQTQSPSFNINEAEIEPQNQSPSVPVIKEIKVEQLMNFPDAIKLITDGRRITKEEWRNREIWVELNDDILKLHKEDGKFYDWIVNGGDLRGEDFFVIN